MYKNLCKIIYSTILRFADKTKNDWGERDNFEKVPGKYDLLIMDYNADDKEKDSVDAPVKTEKKPVVESKLNKRIQTLIELICNIQAMEEMLEEMKYDTKKAPLGKMMNIVFLDNQLWQFKQWGFVEFRYLLCFAVVNKV